MRTRIGPIMTITMALVFASAPVVTFAQATQDLSSTIRAELLSDPRTSSLSQQQLDALVQVLSQEAQRQGVTAEQILWRPQQAEAQQGNVVSELAACDSIACIADQAFGFIGPDTFIAFLLGISAMGLIWILAEMIHRHTYPHLFGGTTPPPIGGQ